MGIVGVAVAVGCFSVEAALRFPFPFAPPWPFVAFFFSGALHTKGGDIGIVGVMMDLVEEVGFVWFGSERVITPV